MPPAFVCFSIVNIIIEPALRFAILKCETGRFQGHLWHTECSGKLRPGMPQGETSPAVVNQQLTPYDGYTRGAGLPLPPIISLPSPAALLRLNLSLSGPASGSLRATLRMFPQQNNIMTVRLANADALHPLVTLDVPATLLLDNKDYIVELRAATSVRTQQTVYTFMFRIAKAAQ